MNGQASTQTSASAPPTSNTNTSPTNKTSTTLVSDPTFQAIHNAFLLGWSLMELKSRIQAVACNLSLPRDAVIVALKEQHTSTQDDSSLPSQPASQPQTAAQTQPQSDPIESLLENVVLKDVIAWKDVKGKLTPASMPTSQEKSLSTELRDNIWLTSVWKAIFTQIAALHVKRFPHSDTTGTIYNLAANDLKNYPYSCLYPSNGKCDYANVGIRNIKKEDFGNNNIDSFVQQFSLYDVTRRALNCLALLLITPEDSLIPETIKDYQQELLKEVLTPPSTSLESDSSNQKPANHQAGTGSNAGQSSNDQADQDNKKKAAIKKLSNLLIPLIEAWDSFLRESFYVNTTGQNDDPESPKYEIELVAYEAGRSLAALSWAVSVALVPLENLEDIDTLLKDEQAKEGGPYPLKDVLTKKVQNTWLNVFNDRDVNHVQHQIAALSTVLDEAYYRIHTEVKPPKPDDPPAPPNPDLPGQAIQAVKHSLDYWEQAIARICEEKKPLAAPMPAKTQPQNHTPALAPVQGVNTAPVQENTTPTRLETDLPRPSKPLDWDTSKTLRTELIQQSAVWQSVILCQQGLRSFTVETVTQKILNDFMQDFEVAASKEVFNNKAFRWTWSIITTISLLIILIIGILFAVNFQGFNINNLLNSPSVIITAIAAIISAIAAATVTLINNLLIRPSKFSSFFSSAGTAIAEALQDGYRRILIEFNYLNHNVGITFPLIEFFVWEEIKFGDNPIEDGYDFLVNVFWTAEDREEEIQRVARAAFGPIGAFVGGSLGLGYNVSQYTSPSKNGSKPLIQQSKMPSPTGTGSASNYVQAESSKEARGP